jgi:hypothetical protein
MNLYIVIGAPGEGKTPFCKQMIGGGDSGRPENRCLVFDINNEYGPRTKYPGQVAFNLPVNYKDIRCRYTGDDIEMFLKIAMSKQNTVVVMEEATAFFEGKTSKLTRRLIINRYHTGNVYVFLFHSINSVPPRIMEIANYVVLFKTNDEHDTVYRKYSRLGPSFDALRDAEHGKGHCKILKLI